MNFGQIELGACIYNYNIIHYFYYLFNTIIITIITIYSLFIKNVITSRINPKWKS